MGRPDRGCSRGSPERHHSFWEAPRWPPGHKGPSSIRQVIVDSFDIEQLTAQGLTVKLPGYQARVDVAPGRPATMHRIALKGNGSGPFTHTPGAEHPLAGSIGAADLAAPLHAQVDNILNSGDVDLKTEAISVEFMSSGATTVDLHHPRLSNLRAALFRGPGISVTEMGADGLKYSDGRMVANAVSVRGIAVDEPGLHLQVPSPGLGDVTISNLGKRRAAPTAVSSSLITVSGASPAVDFTKLSGGGGAGGGGATRDISLVGWRDLLDSIDGHIGATMRVGLHLDNYYRHVLDELDTDLSLRLDIGLTSGRIDYQSVQEAVNQTGATGGTRTGRGAADVATNIFEFWMSGSDRVVGLHITDIDPDGVPPDDTVPIRLELARWSLSRGKTTASNERHLVRLRRLLDVDTSQASSNPRQRHRAPTTSVPKRRTNPRTGPNCTPGRPLSWTISGPTSTSATPHRSSSTSRSGRQWPRPSQASPALRQPQQAPRRPSPAPSRPLQ